MSLYGRVKYAFCLVRPLYRESNAHCGFGFCLPLLLIANNSLAYFYFVSGHIVCIQHD